MQFLIHFLDTEIIIVTWMVGCISVTFYTHWPLILKYSRFTLVRPLLTHSLKAVLCVTICTQIAFLSWIWSAISRSSTNSYNSVQINYLWKWSNIGFRIISKLNNWGLCLCIPILCHILNNKQIVIFVSLLLRILIYQIMSMNEN